MDGNGCSIGTHILSYKPFQESDVLVGVTFLTKKDPLPCWETGLWKGG